MDSWETFISAIQVRFGSSSYDDPMETLTKLRHTTTVSAYKSQFEMISSRIKNLLETHKLNHFLSGLKDEVRLAVRMKNPRTLSATFGLAKIQEEYFSTCRKVYKPFSESGRVNWQEQALNKYNNKNKGPYSKDYSKSYGRKKKKGSLLLL